MYRVSRPAIADSVFVAIVLVWAGMLIGVSFVATPVKFTAPGLMLPTALEVGRVTFQLFSRIEWALAAATLLAAVFGSSRLRIAMAALLAALVILQAAWLLPVLDMRIAAVTAGSPLPPSEHHTFYAGAEAAKLLLLVAAGASALFSRHGRR